MSAQHILVVEDESDIRELLRFNLEREGSACWRPRTARRGWSWPGGICRA